MRIEYSSGVTILQLPESFRCNLCNLDLRRARVIFIKEIQIGLVENKSLPQSILVASV